MSGGDRGGGNGGPTNGGDKCPDFLEPTVLNSPVPKIVEALEERDTLSVEIFRVSGRAILVAKHNGQIAGSITSTGAGKLIGCIDKGYRYIAVVLEVEGGDCHVEIRRRGAY